MAAASSVSLTISPIKDDDGHVVGASKIVRDITDRKRAEADRQKFVTLVENSTDFIGMCDLDGVPFFVNRAGLAMVGLDDIEAARRAPVASFFFPDDQSRIMNEFFPSVLEKGHGEIEVRFRHFKTGEALWMAYKVLTLPEQPAGRWRSQPSARTSPNESDWRRTSRDWPRICPRRTAARTIFWRCSRTSCETRSRRSATPSVRCTSAGGDAETLRAASDMLRRQVGQMSRLVDDLLDLSRITRGRIELRKERIELAAVVQQAVEAVRASVPEQGAGADDRVAVAPGLHACRSREVGAGRRQPVEQRVQVHG